MAPRPAGGDRRGRPHLPDGDLLPLGVAIPPAAPGHPAPQEPEAEDQGEEPDGRHAALLRPGHPQEPHRADPPRVDRPLVLRDHHAYHLPRK